MNLRVVEKAIVHYTNKERRRRNLRKVRRSESLVKAARGHAGWCAGRNRMTHTGTGGTQPWQRARQAGYPSQGVSENMWQQHGQNNTTYKSRFRWRNDWQFGKAAVITWMNSPGHQSNLPANIVDAGQQPDICHNTTLPGWPDVRENGRPNDVEKRQADRPTSTWSSIPTCPGSASGPPASATT